VARSRGGRLFSCGRVPRAYTSRDVLLYIVFRFGAAAASVLGNKIDGGPSTADAYQTTCNCPRIVYDVCARWPDVRPKGFLQCAVGGGATTATQQPSQSSRPLLVVRTDANRTIITRLRVPFRPV